MHVLVLLTVWEITNKTIWPQENKIFHWQVLKLHHPYRYLLVNSNLWIIEYQKNRYLTATIFSPRLLAFSTITPALRGSMPNFDLRSTIAALLHCHPQSLLLWHFDNLPCIAWPIWKERKKNNWCTHITKAYSLLLYIFWEVVEEFKYFCNSFLCPSKLLVSSIHTH